MGNQPAICWVIYANNTGFMMIYDMFKHGECHQENEHNKKTMEHNDDQPGDFA